MREYSTSVGGTRPASRVLYFMIDGHGFFMSVSID